MPAHCWPQNHPQAPTKTQGGSSLEWDEYDNAAYEMWDCANKQGLCEATLKYMADRLRELFPPK